MKKSMNIAILGATGSIGENALSVVAHSSGLFNVKVLAARNSIEKLARQAERFSADTMVVTRVDKLGQLTALAPESCHVTAGEDALVDAVTRADIDIVLCAIAGTGGLRPVIAALKEGKRVALASKEVMVMAGELVMRAAAEGGGEIIPVDSEHSAIFQCLAGRDRSEIRKLILTASGGAFRNASAADMAKATYEEALNHPTWSMGPKISVDSATMMNKALELIEAHYLFGIDPEALEVVIHPQSMVHSLVELVDGSLLAQLSRPDMRMAIQYAFTYPERIAGPMAPLDLNMLRLDFSAPDHRKFPSLHLAAKALEEGGTLPAVLNAANEEAVELFKNGRIAFPEIWRVIDAAMAEHETQGQSSLEVILQSDAWARDFVRDNFA